MTDTTHKDELTWEERQAVGQRAFAAGLRQLADLIDEHPEAAGWGPAHKVYLSCDDRAELVALTRRLGGKWEKSITDDCFNLDRDLGGGVVLHAYVAREEVCEKVLVGTEPVEKPDPEWVAANPAPTITVLEPVYEWKCPDSLLADLPLDEIEAA